MTRTDIDNLFALFAIYRPNDPHLKDKTLRTLWLRTLKPYEPADVKRAVTAYFRESKYWPDPSDISTRCPKVVAEITSAQENHTNFSAREIADINTQMEEMLELGELISADYESAGLPHPAKARRMGWSCRTWMDRCREAVG